MAAAAPAVPATKSSVPATIANSAVMLEKAEQLENAAMEALKILDADVGAFQKTIRTSIAIKALREALTEDVMKVVMELQNTSLGFRTDRDPNQLDADGKPKKPYDVAVVKDCLIEGALKGARWTGNEINIIAGRCYLTKEYFERMVRDFPGVTGVDPKPGVPQEVGEKGALVPYTITWKLNGKPMKLERLRINDAEDYRFAIRKNAGMGTDAILGKARKRAFAAVFSILTGKEAENVEPDDANVIEGTATVRESAPESETSNDNAGGNGGAKDGLFNKQHETAGTK